MARFMGTFKEFHNHIGPRIRNVANAIARKERNARNGLCQHCQKKFPELDSAHIHGRSRRQIIEQVLMKFTINAQGYVDCDLGEVERLIMEAHQPITDNFLFLCKKCHTEYDKPQQHDYKKIRVLNRHETATRSGSAPL